MELEKITAKTYLNSLSILHASLIMGQVLIAGIFYFFGTAGNAPLSAVEAGAQKEFYLVGAAVILGVLASAQLFGTKVRNLAQVKDLKEKLAGYRAALILRYMLLEVPSLLAIFFYFITDNAFLLIFSGMILILFWLYRPTKERLITDLELNAAEQQHINNPDAIIN